MKNLIFTLMMVCFVYGALGAKSIAFLEDPTVAVQQDGLVAALTAKGYTVDISYTPFDYTALAEYDLIIVSRGISSSDFTEYLSWNAITKPVFVLSTYAARDSKMKLINGQNVNPADGSLIDQNLITNGVPQANADGSFDAVFDGVTTGGAPFPYFKWMYCYLNYSLADWELDGNTGKPLVVLPDDATDGAGSVVMARWEPGKEAYAGSGILAGYRSFMNLGTADNATPSNYNMDNYTDASLKLFMNEVSFLINPPVVGAKRIAFLEDPSVEVQQDGLVAALTGEGYTVDISYTPFDYVTLTGYDLIIVSRGVSSSDFNYLEWDAVTKPVFVLSAPCARDSRMKLINGQNVQPADGSLIDQNLITNGVPQANADGSFDAVFDGVTTGGAPFGYFKWMYCYLNYSLADWEADGNTGKPLIVLADDATDGAGSVVMARWEPGTEAYPGSGILAGRRSYMDLGTADDGTTYNMDNYTDTSLKLFLNEVLNLINSSTGVQNLKSESQLKVYPIPSSDGRFTIEMKGSKSGMANVRIYTMTGMQVYDKNVGLDGNISINSGLGKGMYLLVVNTDGNKSSRKIVIR